MAAICQQPPHPACVGVRAVKFIALHRHNSGAPFSTHNISGAIDLRLTEFISRALLFRWNHSNALPGVDGESGSRLKGRCIYFAFSRF